MKLFQYAIIYKPTEEDMKSGRKAELIKGKLGFLISSVLADDIDKAKLHAARDIPDENMKDLDQLEIAVRPF